MLGGKYVMDSNHRFQLGLPTKLISLVNSWLNFVLKSWNCFLQPAKSQSIYILGVSGTNYKLTGL